MLAGRGAASVSVSAFGRSLTLGVGFGFNTGQLERARVDRFLALGLAASTPDPAAGLKPPQPAAPVVSGDAALGAAAVLQARLGDLNEPALPADPANPRLIRIETQGLTPGAPRFWAILFEVQARPGSYVLQLLPRDRTTCEGGVCGIPESASTFFAPPRADGAAPYRIEGLASGLRLKRLAPEGGAQEVQDGEDLAFSGGAVVAVEDDRKLTLGELVGQAFLSEEILVDPASGEVERKGEGLLEPPAERILSPARRGGGARAADEAASQAAAADMSALSYRRAEHRAIEERRSAILSAVCESAMALAAGAALDEQDALIWPGRKPPTPEGVVDARDFGLTFLVEPSDPLAPPMEDDLGGLFLPPSGRGPGAATFALRARRNGAGEDAFEDSPVHLLNPPSRFFSAANPRLEGATATQDSGGLALDWDLEPNWREIPLDDAQPSLWDDPEYHLKHYRIQRSFLRGGAVAASAPVMETTVKACSPLRARLEGEDLVWERVRPLAQFVDDFADLPPLWRDALLALGGKTPQAREKAEEAWEILRGAGLVDGAQEEIRIDYLIVPVDSCGTEGVAQPIETRIPKPAPAARPIARAEMRIAFARLPGVAAQGGAKAASNAASLSMRLDDLAFSAANLDEQPQRLPKDGTRYRIRIRAESSTPIGLYGADALGEALNRPGAANFARKRNDDLDVTLVLRWPEASLDDGEAYAREQALEFAPLLPARPEGSPCFHLESRSDFAALLAAFGDEKAAGRTAPRSLRAAVARLDAQGESTVTDWTPLDLTLRVGAVTTDALGRPQPPPIDTVMELFETPLVAGFAPLPAEDLEAKAGKLLIDHPRHDATLKDFLGCGEDESGPRKASVVRLRDGENREATRLSWSAFPAASLADEAAAAELLPPAANSSPAFIAGFDVFEIDMLGVDRMEDHVSGAVEVARVMTLDPRLSRAEPEGIEDFAGVEAWYPSDSLRLERPGAAGRAAWFSPAESLGVWPRPVLRRSLGLGVDDAVLAPLFRKGPPLKLVLRWSDSDQAGGAGTLSSLARLRKAAAGREPGAFLWISDDGEEIPLKGEVGPEILGEAPEAGAGAPLRWTPLRLRRLLYGLIFKADPALEAAYLSGETPESLAPLASLTIEVSAFLREGETAPVETVGFGTALHTPLHAVLADLTEALAWEVGQKTRHRRYRAVLEAEPVSQARTLGALFAERTPESDAYGWAILRSLGLAAGLRLFDMQAGDYLEPVETLRLADAAFGVVLRRYEGSELGAPMAELLLRSGAAQHLASADGGAREADESDERRLRDRLAPLLQISLRPAAEALLGRKAAMRYGCARLEGEPSTDPELRIFAVLSIGARWRNSIVEVMDLSGAFSSERRFLLGRPEAGASRSEPLTPPVILAARRLDRAPGDGGRTGARPGRLLEFALARHVDQTLSEANAAVADALEVEHLAVGFWRGFAHEAWLARLTRLATAEGADWSCDPSPPKLLEFVEPFPLETNPPAFPETPQEVLRIESPPHFYQTKVVAFMAAGTVVSEPVAATAPEGYHELNWPWAPDPPDAPPPDALPPEAAPLWSLAREGGDGAAILSVEWPLLRMADGMSAEDRRRWLPESAKERRVFRLPDPAVGYALATRPSAAETSLLAEISGDFSPEMEISAAPSAAEETEAAAYLLKSVGARLVGLASELRLGEDEVWRLTIRARLAEAGDDVGAAGVRPVSRLIPEALRDLAAWLRKDPDLGWLLGFRLLGAKADEDVEDPENAATAEARILSLPFPPDQEELRRVFAAVDRAAADPETAEAFKAFVLRLAEDQIFGPNRSLCLKATKGFLDAILAPVRRRREEGS